MAEEKQQDGQKTIVAFIVGLLIGGLLVWAFSQPGATPATDTHTDEHAASEETSTETADAADSEETDTTAAPAPTLPVGEGSVTVSNQPASASVALEAATYPVSEGWIGVREFTNEQMGYILGVVRFSETGGLVPANIVLQRPTIAGRDYAVVFFTEDGDGAFNSATDAQIATVYGSFKAE